MSRYKAVIFDYGGVIADGGAGNEATGRLAQLLDISQERAHELIQPAWQKLIRGKINETRFWDIIAQTYGRRISPAQRSHPIWNTWDVMQPRPAMIALVKDLKQHNYTVGLLSNVIPHTEALIRANNGYELFHPCILSCHYGAAKPEPAIYEELLRQLKGVAPNEIIFIDDNSRCLEPARKKGIITVLADNQDQIISDVKRLLQLS